MSDEHPLLHPVQFGHVSELQLLDSGVHQGREHAYAAMMHEAMDKGHSEAATHFARKSVDSRRKSNSALKSDRPAEKFNIKLDTAGVGMGRAN